MWRAGKLAAVILATRDATCLSAVNHGVGVPMSCEGGVEWITSPTIQESGRTFPAPGVSGNNPRKLPPLPCSGSCRPFLNSIMWTRLTTRIEKDSPQEHTGRKVFYKTLVDVLMCVANTHEGKSSEKTLVYVLMFEANIHEGKSSEKNPTGLCLIVCERRSNVASITSLNVSEKHNTFYSILFTYKIL